jgi:hypothetical protein
VCAGRGLACSWPYCCCCTPGGLLWRVVGGLACQYNKLAGAVGGGNNTLQRGAGRSYCQEVEFAVGEQRGTLHPDAGTGGWHFGACFIAACRNLTRMSWCKWRHCATASFNSVSASRGSAASGRHPWYRMRPTVSRACKLVSKAVVSNFHSVSNN